jgi:hypothetical protein
LNRKLNGKKNKERGAGKLASLLVSQYNEGLYWLAT